MDRKGRREREREDRREGRGARTVTASRREHKEERIKERKR